MRHQKCWINYPKIFQAADITYAISAALKHSATSFRPVFPCQQQKFDENFHVAPVNTFLIILCYVKNLTF